MTIMKKFFFFALMAVTTVACSNETATSNGATPIEYTKGSFGYDRDFIKKYDSNAVTLQYGESEIIVSPKYQAKVFTSTVAGESGQSFGWINYAAFDRPAGPHINPYGGENRIWLAPEGGKFSLYFKKGDAMDYTHWQTPAAFDSEPWTLGNHDGSTVALRKDMELTNYSGTRLTCSVERFISILPENRIDSLLGINLDHTVGAVGYQTTNTLINTGKDSWTETTGMPAIWLLDMLKVSDSNTIVVPYKNSSTQKDKIATTDYFGEIPAARIHYDHSTIFFKADGKKRCKLGVSPTRAKNRIGSYDPINRVLTICLFDLEKNAKYLNQEWNTVKPTFSGDVINAYNDGPLADSSQLGPFYELESVAPAVALQPGQQTTHRHAVFHFTGDEKSLDTIAQKVLGVSLEQIKTALK